MPWQYPTSRCSAAIACKIRPSFFFIPCFISSVRALPLSARSSAGVNRNDVDRTMLSSRGIPGKLPVKLPTGETPPQSLTVLLGVWLISLLAEPSSPLPSSPLFSHGGGLVHGLARSLCSLPSVPTVGVGTTSPPPFTPLGMMRFLPHVTNALTMESVRNRAPVLCGGMLPNDRATSRSMMWLHLPSSPSCARPSRSKYSCWISSPSASCLNFCRVIHIQNAGRTFMLMPPARTASRISTCSFSATSLRQNRFTIFILHTATGSPR
mmetsp:Transcript_11565/g.33268  ORF Transcript_11565/g.33268 Transcript_11565/m.33268 type:complete len:266 (-) Transcript_11565:2323-3120(-)